MIKRIIDVFNKSKSDKKEHGYPEIYAKHLPDRVDKIIEFGVKEGYSIQAWHEIYPEAHIYGVDIFQEYQPPFTADWVTWIKGSQRDGDLLNHIRAHGPFDICIDDASHNHRDQLITFFGMWGCTKLYVCEDIVQDDFWAQGLPLDDNIKSLNVNAKIFNYDKIKFFYAP